ncbi:Dot/Icm T4SS effector CpeH [Coxiella burnetii]|uniref:Dot/Icm T4SS effector CpeH n=1 Tax=Coxiella burnetii TaxID=777 RepID=UPI0005C6B3B9|nr:Dot/Icm T4SS effector CpeH [Coxiella burnetii]ATN83095.1 hypothetical protein AYO24_10485 [Coxiella burnetii]ATN84983.1 hypothetical protein AYO23_10410 [Coxiella burnetii]POZ74188.1 hypothetical protein CbuRSA461_10970 [Coxiella burnetii]
MWALIRQKNWIFKKKTLKYKNRSTFLYINLFEAEAVGIWMSIKLNIQFTRSFTERLQSTNTNPLMIKC